METKPFYKSTTFRGLLVSVVALIIGKGADLDSAQMQVVVEVVSSILQVLGLAIAAYGRMKADTKITIGGTK